MRESDKTDFYVLLGNVCAFYRQDFSAFAGSVWWRAMAPHDLKAVADALNRHCVNPDNGQFMPKPADIVKMLQGSTQDAALVAWSKVDQGIRVRGTYCSVVFDDAIIHRVLMDMGGWVPLGTKTEDEWPFVKNEFVNRYRGYRGRSEIPEYPPVLTGIAEAQNRMNGQRVEMPVLIGNSAAAKRVMDGGVDKPLLGFAQLAADKPLLKLAGAA